MQKRQESESIFSIILGYDPYLIFGLSCHISKVDNLG